MDIESPIEGNLASVKRKVSSEDFGIITNTLNKIFTNIRENLISEKYRTLKKSNQKIAVLTSLADVAQILRFGGFEDNGSAYVMTKVNIGTIDECI